VPVVPGAAARGLLADIFRGLSALHSLGIIHRDLKSANVPTPRRPPPGTAAQGPSSTSAPSSSPLRELTPAIDVYSAGVVAWELAAGAVPHRGKGLFEVQRLVAERGTLEFPDSLAADPDWAVIVPLAKWCFSFDPADRPTASEAYRCPAM
jgi:serine/threonine-protein kinase